MRTKKEISDYCRQWHRNFYENNTEHELERKKNYKWEMKQIALFIYSDGHMICNKCGFNDIDCLDLDHIDNDGNKTRKETNKMGIYFYLNKLDYPIGYQVLCRNCNWKKYLENQDKLE